MKTTPQDPENWPLRGQQLAITSPSGRCWRESGGCGGSHLRDTREPQRNGFEL